MPRRLMPALIVAMLSALLVIVPIQAAAPPQQSSQTVTLNPGDSLTVNCSTSLAGSFATNLAALSCATAEATPTAPPTSTATVTPSPTATNTPVAPTSTPTATATPHAHTGLCGESMATWHPPVVNGCQTKHEHGDAPPDWVNSSPWPAMFDHPGNTPNENVLKHTSFKGFTARFNNVDLYVIQHLDTNPSGHSSRFHSYQMWARDASGALSHWDGWMDFGDDEMAGPQIQRFHCDDPDGVRPVMAVNSQQCPGPLRFENWYPRAGGYLGQAGWMPDFGFNTSANYFFGGDPAVPSTWVPTGGMNGTRRIEVAWYANRSSQRGTFYATNFGQLVSGPNDPACGTTKTVGGRTYPVTCIEQRIAPTLNTIQFPNNAVQKTYDMTGVVNPN